MGESKVLEEEMLDKLFMGGMTLAGLDPTNGLPLSQKWTPGHKEGAEHRGWGNWEQEGCAECQTCLRDPCSSRESELWELIQQLSRKNHPKNSHSRSDKAEKKSDCSAGSWSEESRPVQLELDPAGVFVGQSFPYICLKEKSHMEWMQLNGACSLSPEVLTVVYASTIWWWHRNVSLFLYKLREQRQK